MASVAVYPVGQGFRDEDRWNGPEEWAAEERVSAWRQEQIRPSQCHVRAFPNEDILFWNKPEIDNGRVVRQHDPHAVTACWKGVSAAAAVVLIAVGLLLPKAHGLISGMQVDHLCKRQSELIERRRQLTLQETQLTTPAQIEEMAREFGFQPPTPETMARLDAGSLAPSVERNASNRNGGSAGH
ncbi:MAG: hypothetical protein FJW31_16595 [Acidobacteria bacterium]|nr:hypothetical protein [Acidobacteriota bacterium]